MLPHTYEVFGVAFSSDRTLCATATWDGRANVWDSATGQPVVGYSYDNKCPINAVCFERRPSGGRPRPLYLAVEQFLSELDLPGRGVTRLPAAEREGKICLAADGRTILSGTAFDDVRVSDVATGCEIVRLTTARPAGPERGIVAGALSPDGAMAYAAFKSGRIAVFDVAAARELAPICTHPSVRLLALSPDRRHAVVADGGTVAVWDLARRERVFATKSPSTLVPGAALAALVAPIVTLRSGGQLRLGTGAPPRSTPSPSKRKRSAS